MNVLINSYRKIEEYLSSRIAWKIALWGWLIVMMTIGLLVFRLIPLEKENALNRMDTEALDIAASILATNRSALITEEYGLVIDHCQNIVNSSSSIQYLVITKKNSTSLVFKKNQWSMENLEGDWLPDTSKLSNEIRYSKLVNKEVFQRTVNFSYLGIFWGYIHIGLSLDKYNSSLEKINTSIARITLITAIIGFLLSIWLARLLTRPILILDRTTKEIAAGNMNARAKINSRDELFSLAQSFNSMTDSLIAAQENLENKVIDRTKKLEEINKILSVEIGERLNAEQSLKHSLDEKEVLLKEIHHRVKNNLQIITSLLYLESKKLNDENVISAFKNSQSRIKSMALVHEKLYSSREFSKVNFKDYLRELVENLSQSYNSLDKPIYCEFDLDLIELPIDTAIPLGLIMNELSINAFKYAYNPFPDSGNCKIKIKAKKLPDSKLIFSIEDNGVGLPNDFALENLTSLGLKLVTNLCDQLDGELNIESKHGTKFEIKLNALESDMTKS